MIRKIFIDKPLQQKLKITDGNLKQRLKNILRLKINDLIIFLNNFGEMGLYVIENSNYSEFRLLKYLPRNNKPKKLINLYLAIPKKQTLEEVIKLGTFLGVSNFYIFRAERSQYQISSNTLNRLNKIIYSSLEITPWQHTPYLESKNFADIVNLKNIFVLDQDGEDFRFDLPSEINIFLGPEGGWSIKEKNVFKSSGAKFISLGKINLKLEIALAVFLSLVNFPLNDSDSKL